MPRQELLPPKLRDLFFTPGRNGVPVYVKSRYKIAYGGRGSSKSWGFARLLLLLAAQYVLRILCVRELQNSIKDSVHQLLADQIVALGLEDQFIVQNDAIYSKIGSKILFVGIKSDPAKIKSTEGINITFIEEAEKVSETSWKFLIPTVTRKNGSEIWVVFNPRDESDPTYVRYVKRMPFFARRVKIDYMDNPWFPAGMEEQRQYALSLIRAAQDDPKGDPEQVAQLQADYDHVWLGACQKNGMATVFRRRVIVEWFDEPPEKTQIRYGADWGYANDPTALIRFWITTHADAKVNGIPAQELWISHEAYGYTTELDDIPALFDSVPGSRKWPIKADCSRPETISLIRRAGFNITAAEKWSGSVEDGVEHIRAYRKIHIHSRCKRIEEEARLYSYKVDRVTNEVLPIIVDKWNHGWDAVRYGLDGEIQRRGVAAQWARLGRAP